MIRQLYLDTVLPHLGAIIGFSLGFILVARLMREKRRPSSTFAWLLLIILVPYIGVPLYFLIGGRKIRKLSRGKDSINLLAQAPASETVSTSPFGLVARGNRTQFLSDGAAAYDALVDSIKEAQTSIDITTFILSHDAVGRRIVKELAQRAREGVAVRLLVDALGSFGKKTLYMLELEKAGGKIERFMPVFPISFPGAANLRNHRKIAIFDKTKAIVGGRNIGRDYMGPTLAKGRWKDLGVVIEGPAVMALNTIVEEDWAFAARKRGYVVQPQPVVSSVAGADNVIEIMASGPDTTGDPLYEKILSAIHEAERSIKIVTPYFIPDDVLLRSLIVKARTGKSVTLIVPKRSNHRITDLARRQHLRELSAAGIQILAYSDSMLHAKALLVDDRLAMTGSANMDMRSLFVNYEVAAFFYDSSDIRKFEDWIRELEAGSEALDEKSLAPARGLRGIAEDISRLVAPLL